MALAFGPLLKGFGLHHNLQSQPGCIVAELCILLLWSLNTFSRFDQVIFLLVHVIHVPFQQGSGARVFHGFDVLPQSRLVLKDPHGCKLDQCTGLSCLRDESNVWKNPPTPAFAKAGAAPGTTAGVELVFLSNRHPKATSMAFYGRPRLPFASPKTLQTPKTPQRHFHGFLWASSAGKSPHPWLFMGVQACRLPGLKPSKPSKPLKPLKGHFNGFL